MNLAWLLLLFPASVIVLSIIGLIMDSMGKTADKISRHDEEE